MKIAKPKPFKPSKPATRARATAPARPLKLARAHILRTIERALEISGPVRYDYPRYSIEATPLRRPGKKGNFGLRVTWFAPAALGEKK